MKRYAVLSVVLTINLILLTGCAVGLAASGKKNLNTAIAYPGVPRRAVIARLGPPETSITDNEGNYIDSYIIVKGNEPSLDRAVMHGAMDLLTFGLWELIGTPVELMAGVETNSILLIYYDSEENIKDIQSADTLAAQKSVAETDQNKAAEGEGIK